MHRLDAFRWPLAQLPNRWKPGSQSEKICPSQEKPAIYAFGCPHRAAFVRTSTNPSRRSEARQMTQSPVGSFAGPTPDLTMFGPQNAVSDDHFTRVSFRLEPV